MPEPEDLQFDPDSFQGIARLFPLPNLVLFPHVLQPLHIFEPRYCELLEEALADDRLIAMAVLSPGWEKNYEGRPAVWPVACLGRIATHARLADGRHNLLLAGVARLKLGEELPPTTSFRQARASILADRFPPGGAATQDNLRRELMALFRDVLPHTPQAQMPLEQLLGAQVDLAALADIVSYTLDLTLDEKVRLLAEPDVGARVRGLLEHLKSRHGQRTKSKDYPPPFSVN